MSEDERTALAREAFRIYMTSRPYWMQNEDVKQRLWDAFKHGFDFAFHIKPKE
jgi:hypothetical protein